MNYKPAPPEVPGGDYKALILDRIEAQRAGHKATAQALAEKIEGYHSALRKYHDDIIVYNRGRAK